MSDIHQYIGNSQKIISIFGHWPMFHDAEIFEFHLWRGNMDPETQTYILPVLTVKILLMQMTSETDEKGCYSFIKHTLATLRFHHVEKIEMKDFNYQNAIYELAIERQERVTGPSPVFIVQFDSAFGMDAMLECGAIEVLDAIPCNQKGCINPI